MYRRDLLGVSKDKEIQLDRILEYHSTNSFLVFYFFILSSLLALLFFFSYRQFLFQTKVPGHLISMETSSENLGIKMIYEFIAVSTQSKKLIKRLHGLIELGICSHIDQLLISFLFKLF